MSDKFRPLKTVKVTCKECGHTGAMGISELQFNTQAVNAIAKIRHDEREKVESELALLRKENERLAWNLGGCDTYALGYGLEGKHDEAMALPALNSVRKMAEQNALLRKENEEKARLLGISGSKEAKLLAEIEKFMKENEKIRCNDCGMNQINSCHCMCDSEINKYKNVVEAAKAEHKARMGKDYQNGADCRLCKALAALEGKR